MVIRSKAKVINDPNQWRRLLEQSAESALAHLEHPIVLDAGCGSQSHILYPERVHLAGIDNCKEAVEQNRQLDEYIIADLQTYPLPKKCYDLITCIDVIEHLPNPEQALSNMWQALKPGGTLIIRAPYLYSVKGIIAKFTPHWVHVAFRRYILRNPNAGKPGYPPFKTFLRPSMTPESVIRWISENQGEIVDFYLRLGNNPYGLRQKSIITYLAYRGVTTVVTLITLGRFHEYTDYLLIARRSKGMPSQ
jgi:2-polyprenyl-3-methyl-5-hydroxy-6-metoxy-1,4-benzoquinol methylase